MRPQDNNAVSLAGEFAVLSQLALRNFDANMTLGHTKSVDILVSDPATRKMYKLEVKTTRQSRKKDMSESRVHGKFLDCWMMDKKHESVIDPSLFYCFVIIVERGKEHIFRFFIVPSKIVARYVKEQHQHWLKIKEKEGLVVKDTAMRLFRIGLMGEEYPVAMPLVESYEDNWNFM
jgi:hypothetical protein